MCEHCDILFGNALMSRAPKFKLRTSTLFVIYGKYTCAVYHYIFDSRLFKPLNLIIIGVGFIHMLSLFVGV